MVSTEANTDGLLKRGGLRAFAYYASEIVVGLALVVMAMSISPGPVVSGLIAFSGVGIVLSSVYGLITATSPAVTTNRFWVAIGSGLLALIGLVLMIV